MEKLLSLLKSWYDEVVEKERKESMKNAKGDSRGKGVSSY